MKDFIIDHIDTRLIDEVIDIVKSEEGKRTLHDLLIGKIQEANIKKASIDKVITSLLFNRSCYNPVQFNNTIEESRANIKKLEYLISYLKFKVNELSD